MITIRIPPERQVTTLQLSKELSALGMPQYSLFFWVFDKEKNVFSLQTATTISALALDEKYAAFTSEELGSYLPDHIIVNDKDGRVTAHLKSYKITQEDSKGRKWPGWCISYYKNENLCIGGGISDTSECNARGKLIVYLMKNKILAFKKI